MGGGVPTLSGEHMLLIPKVSILSEQTYIHLYYSPDGSGELI